MTDTTTERAALVQGLRDLADFLAAHPELPGPLVPQFNVWGLQKADLARMVLKGSWEKIYQGGLFMLRRSFGPVQLDFNADRSQVCRRVVTGTRVIPPTPEQIVEDVEWICEDSLLGYDPVGTE